MRAVRGSEGMDGGRCRGTGLGVSRPWSGAARTEWGKGPWEEVRSAGAGRTGKRSLKAKQRNDPTSFTVNRNPLAACH